jgi:thymidylate kinase
VVTGRRGEERSVRRTAKVVIVEGTCGSGKTTLVRAAGSMFEGYEIRALLQRSTYGPIAAREDDGTLDDQSNRAALLDIVHHIRDELVGENHLVVVDALHATHFVRLGVLSVESFVEIDRALDDLGALVIALRISDESIRARAIVGRRGTGFYEYARKFGATEDDRTDYFAREQVRLFDVLGTHSRLPRLVLDGDEAAESLQARFRRVVQQYLDA